MATPRHGHYVIIRGKKPHNILHGDLLNMRRQVSMLSDVLGLATFSTGGITFGLYDIKRRIEWMVEQCEAFEHMSEAEQDALRAKARDYALHGTLIDDDTAPAGAPDGNGPPRVADPPRGADPPSREDPARRPGLGSESWSSPSDGAAFGSRDIRGDCDCRTGAIVNCTYEVIDGAVVVCCTACRRRMDVK